MYITTIQPWVLGVWIPAPHFQSDHSLGAMSPRIESVESAHSTMPSGLVLGLVGQCVLLCLGMVLFLGRDQTSSAYPCAGKGAGGSSSSPQPYTDGDSPFGYS